ncbi:DUF1992 domain-containing protein [Yokenella regensburgei]|uniref:DnaJ family domain-containing protein n=1 Tax=Yokenella regensburgei TaxID=158877 RepID=UPI003F1650E6
MWLIDQWAERHIRDAQVKGELDDLPGSGKPLILEDNSQVPPELRAGFTLLKNSGFLPPELEYRKEALKLNDLLQQLPTGHPDYAPLRRRLSLLELKLRQAGLNVDFLHTDYAAKILQKIEEQK